MTYEQYWGASPFLKLDKAYHEAEQLRLRKKNEELWLNGMYTFQAVSTVVSNINLGKSRGKKPNQYLDKPLDIFPKTEAELKAEKDKATQKVVEQLNALKRAWDRKEEHKQDG